MTLPIAAVCGRSSRRLALRLATIVAVVAAALSTFLTLGFNDGSTCGCDEAFTLAGPVGLAILVAELLVSLQAPSPFRGRGPRAVEMIVHLAVLCEALLALLIAAASFDTRAQDLVMAAHTSLLTIVVLRVIVHHRTGGDIAPVPGAPIAS